ncbi:hypothetical protein P879_06591 [Paragonimus westermani]|uniref:Fragile site-associated protein C-terminal domain-containing protein n=1 Tax=Paragonimus westermani TaxID=34504 RepID=A0A8T0DL38_9TREM|nr:hypothetical protein P879_06591 [Paragonimus westermani]
MFPPPPVSLSSSSFMDLFWSHAHRLIPAIKFNLELTKICAGNHLLPRACMLSCTRLVGCYTREEPTYQSDKYQHKISADFVNLLCSLLPVSEYAGQHAIEEPPESWDRTFHVFHFGRGMLTYIQDEPGLISNEPDQLYMSGGDITVLRTWPRWESTIVVTKDCHFYYGPWADRQREILWRFFFPSSYEPTQISVPPSHGQPRVARKLVVEVKTTTNIELNIVFVDHGQNQSIQLIASSDSSLKLSVPWLIEPDGMRTTFRASLVRGNIVAQHLWSDVLQTSQLDLDLYMFYPREWNTPHQWDINVKAKNPRLTVLFDYKRFFKGLIEDWTRGTHPDLLCFVPCTYTFRVSAENLDFILLANEYNWVSAAGENAYIAFSGKRFNLSFDLPFVDYLPDVVSLFYTVEGFSATLRLSLPETSTVLHVLREMHSRLKLVSRSGGSLSTNPFELHDEALSANLPAGSSVRRHWIDCGRAQSLTLRIGYVYHPSPWTAEHWRFVPVELRPEWPMAKPTAQLGCTRHRHHDRKAHPSSLYHPNSDSSSQSELEELALRGLRPEGSQTHGPTEAHLLESKFDVAYLAPDTVDVHLHIPNAQLCFYGALLRHFIHLKENYFGFCQKPVDFAKSPITGEEYLLSMMGPSSLPRGRTQETSAPFAATERVDLKGFKDGEIVDPRDYRPLMVRLSLEFHNVQVHLPVHCSSSTAPCPTAFLDCVGFEMDKRWHETKIQLLFSPILLCTYDHPKPARPKSSSALSTGCIQLMGLCLRGQGMFSHAMLPLDAESLEYAWLLELTVGQLTGQLTAPQLASVVRALNSFTFTMIDAENQLVRSHAFELCQHARPQALCPLRPTVVPKMLCPGESLLKYRFVRVSLDGLDVGIVETGSCLSIQLDPVRLTNCNMHGTTRCNGLFILFPGVRLKQYIRSTSEEYRSFKNPVGYFNKIVDPVNGSNLKHQQSPWLAAGSLSLGPVHVNVAKVAERPEIPLWRLAFLKRHDLATKRLWFLWSNEAKKNHTRFRRAPKMTFVNSTYVAPSITQNCGCFGQCSFFGPNAYGHMLFDELSSGNFQQRAVFPPRSDYKSHLFSLNNTQCVNNQYAPFDLGSAYSSSKDDTPNAAPSAVHFGESLLVEHRLLHELHNPSFCQERHNGLSLMRYETIVAYALSTFSSEVPKTCGRCCDDCDLSDHADDSMSSSNTEPSLPGSPMDNGHPLYYREASSSCDHYHHKRQAVLTKSASRPSSMSELLVPPDSQDEDDVSSMLGSFSKGPNTQDVAFRRSFFNRLPSDLSLNSLIGPLTPSQPSSRASLGSDNLHTTGESEVHITPVIPTKPTTPLRLHIPPTPPPRQFTKKTTDNLVALKTVHSEPLEVVTSSDVVIESNLEKVSEKFVDLRGQLNRPITDSGLLRSAYSHHLSVYRCASDWAPTVKLNRRWHLCKFVYSNSELHPTRYNASDTSADQANRVRLTWPYCRMGPAQAPRFELVQPGFSPRHIVSKTDAQPTGCSTEKSTGASVSDSVGHGTKKRIAARSDVIVWLQNSVDLLLSPLFAESLERYLAVLTPVMINTSPSAVVNQLHIHCVNLQSRKIGHSIQTRPSNVHTYPTSTPNEDPFISSDRLDTSTGLLHQHVFTGSHPLPPPSLDPPAKQSGQKVFAPHAASVNIVPEASGTLADCVRSLGEPVKLLAEPITPAASEITHVSQRNIGGPQVLPVSKQTSFDRRLSVPCRGLCESRTGRVIGSGKLAALSVERINICFLQLYAVEDLVHLDSLRSGLHDLTCVSLLTFCVESVSFEMMSCNETHAILPNLEVPPLTPVESEVSSGGSDPSRQPLLQKFPEESSHDFVNSKRPNDRKWGTQSTSQNTVALAPSKPSHLVSYPSLPEAGSPVSNPALSVIALPACRLSHSRQPSAPPALTTNSVPEEHPVLAVSLADCLHHGSASCIADQKLTSHNSSISQTAVINSKKETYRPLSTRAPPNHCHHQPATDGTAQGEVYDDQVMIDLANVLSYHSVPGSESVFQLNISRIHGQLRRLTRCSQFSANVLLTAIPFESSRTFFAFEFDKDLQTNLTQPVSASRSVSSWNEQSAGWIMFECGLENLSLSCDYRDGFGDTVSDGKLAVNCVKPIHTDHGETSEEEHLSVHESTSAKLRANKQPSFRKKKMSISTGFAIPGSAARSSSYSGQPESKHRFYPILRNVVGSGEKQANVFRNGVLSQLRVSTVWLNFPTPKRLPNKRRVELVR